MAKIDEQNVEGGETAMLHLDDWEHCDDLFNDPVVNRILLGAHQKVRT
jgi:protein CsiD